MNTEQMSAEEVLAVIEGAALWCTGKSAVGSDLNLSAARTAVAAMTEREAALRDEVEALRDLLAENVHLKFELSASKREVKALQADLARVSSEIGLPPTICPAPGVIAALREDAERYRWLRTRHWSDSTLAVVRYPRDAVKLGHELPSLDRLDGAIDAARAEARK